MCCWGPGAGCGGCFCSERTLAHWCVCARRAVACGEECVQSVCARVCARVVLQAARAPDAFRGNRAPQLVRVYDTERPPLSSDTPCVFSESGGVWVALCVDRQAGRCVFGVTGPTAGRPKHAATARWCCAMTVCRGCVLSHTREQAPDRPLLQHHWNEVHATTPLCARLPVSLFHDSARRVCVCVRLLMCVWLGVYIARLS
jgi:hypothetical protein